MKRSNWRNRPKTCEPATVSLIGHRIKCWRRSRPHAARRRANRQARSAAAPWNLTDDATGAPRRLPPTERRAGVGGLAENKAEALRLIAQARAALDRGDLLTAKQSAEQAQNLVPESAYAANETRPWMVLLEVNKALNARGGVVPAGNFESQNALATDANSGGAYPVSQGIYDPADRRVTQRGRPIAAAHAGRAAGSRPRPRHKSRRDNSCIKTDCAHWKAMIAMPP